MNFLMEANLYHLSDHVFSYLICLLRHSTELFVALPELIGVDSLSFE